jgi:hypothetical protein
MNYYVESGEIFVDFSTDVTLVSLRGVLPFLIKIFLWSTILHVKHFITTCLHVIRVPLLDVFEIRRVFNQV